MLALGILHSRAASPASDTGCTDTIANNNTGGFGFNAWTNVSITSGGGLYTTTDASLGSNGCSTAWGIYTGTSTGTTSVQRPFTNYTALSVGQTVMADMHNGGIQTGGGGSEGMTLLNSSGNTLWQLYFVGGANSWTTNAASGAGATTIPYAGGSGACRVFFTLTSATTWSLTAQVPVGGTNYGPFTGTLLNPSGGQSVTTVGFFTTDIGSGNNIQVNNLGVGYDTPTISAQPASTTTTTYGSTTPAMTVTGASTDGTTVGYAWRKRGSGWGSAWTFDNTAGSGAGSAFLASSPEIDTGGQAWGLQQTTNTTATDAIRVLPSVLSANQTLSVDMDNKSVTSGGSVGVSLQDSSGNNGFEFYFSGGGANYSVLDYSSTARNTAVPFTSTGLHLDFTLTSSTNYTLRIKQLANGATVIMTGSVTNHSMSRVRFFDFESGASHNVYFNNLVVAGADDNAGNYSGGWSGDKGQKSLADGATGTGSTNSGSTTASFTIKNAQVADNTNYDCAVMSGQGLTIISSATTLTVNKAIPVLTAPAAGSITYGQTLASSTLTGGAATNSNNNASVAGTFVYTTPGTAPGAGTASQSVTFTPTETTDYSNATATVNVTVNKATPVLTAPTASSITYGQTLASSTLSGGAATNLNNNASVAGSFAFTTPGATPGIGTASQSVTFTPSDTTDYNSATTATSVTVNQIPTSVSVGSSENPSGYKDSISFTAGLPSGATGSVTFLTNGVVFDTESLSGGSATSVATASLPRGANAITAQYAGDGTYAGSTNSLSQMVTNHPPAAMTMTVTRTAGLNLIISLANLATNWSDTDGDTVTLAAVNLVSTNGINLATNRSYIFYTNGPSANDQVSYSISDGQGGTNIGFVNIVVSNSVPGNYLISSIVPGATNLVTSYGIPGYTYILERSTNLIPLVWVDISTNTAQAGGLINAADNFWDLGGTPPSSAYYRLKWNP